MDDGLRSGLITLEQARSVPLFEQYYSEVNSGYPELLERRKIHETVRRLINALIFDLLVLFSCEVV
jgi:dGTPase